LKIMFGSQPGGPPRGPHGSAPKGAEAPSARWRSGGTGWGRLLRWGAALMRLTLKDEFVSAAERANAALDLSHQPESGATLTPPRAPAHRAVQADIGQGLVESGWFLQEHVSPLDAPSSQSGYQFWSLMSWFSRKGFDAPLIPTLIIARSTCSVVVTHRGKNILISVINGPATA